MNRTRGLAALSVVALAVVVMAGERQVQMLGTPGAVINDRDDAFDRDRPLREADSDRPALRGEPVARDGMRDRRSDSDDDRMDERAMRDRDDADRSHADHSRADSGRMMDRDRRDHRADERENAGRMSDRDRDRREDRGEMRFDGRGQRDQARFSRVDSDLLCATVVDRDDYVIGRVDELLVDWTSGRIAFVVVRFNRPEDISGEHRRALAAIPWQTFTTRGGRDTRLTGLKLQAPLREVRAFTFSESDWPNLADARWATDVYRHFGEQPYWAQDERSAREMRGPGDLRDRDRDRERLQGETISPNPQERDRMNRERPGAGSFDRERADRDRTAPERPDRESGQRPDGEGPEKMSPGINAPATRPSAGGQESSAEPSPSEANQQ